MKILKKVLNNIVIENKTHKPAKNSLEKERIVMESETKKVSSLPPKG
ncbi:hypothetical protein KW795_02980 [Candidatus Microgenomates bacterium]|nr:hypothetical protein [Candidatus Microgenomates bacterium]